MSHTDALNRAPLVTGYEIDSATGSDVDTWNVVRRVADGTKYTCRLEWVESTIAPRGGFWHNVKTDLAPAGVDWVPGICWPEEPAG